MLSPEYLAQLPEPLIKLWQLVEDDILRDIGRRIRKMDKLTDTAAYQAFRLEQTKLLRTDIVKLISKYSGKSETAIRKMLKDAAVETLRSEDAIHAAAGVVLPPINESKNLTNLLNAGYRQTIGTWKNLTATTANTVTRQFEDALDRAWLQVSSGAFDYQTAIRNAVDDLAQHMDGVTYPSGHHDTLEVAVRRAALTGVNQTCGKLQWERMEQAGCEFVEVTAHSGARDTGTGPANHAKWQGKVYHIGGAIWYEGVYCEDFVTATGYGTGEGLCGWNCRHNFCSFWPGISTRVYTDEQLAALSAKNIEYNGNKYSQYEINQMQRERERNVRKWKKTWMVEKEAGLDTTTSAIYLKNARKSLTDFVKATGSRVDGSRLSTWNTSKLPGKRFSHSQATSANWDARKRIAEVGEKAALMNWHTIPVAGGRTDTKYRRIKQSVETDIDNVDAANKIIDKNVTATNPAYNSGNPAYRQNCQRCVATYEMRRRGYDVIAKPAIIDKEGKLSPNDPLTKSWKDIFEGANFLPYTDYEGGKTSIMAQMDEWGDGSVAEVKVIWKKGGAHVFVAQRVNGTVRFIDPQNGSTNCEEYFTNAVIGGTMMARIDTLQPTDLIKKCIKNRGGKT